MASTTEGTPYVEASDLVSGWPAVSQSLAEEIDDRIGNPDTSAPSAPSTGQLWVDTTSTPVLKVYTGSTFTPVASSDSGLVLITSQSFTTASAVNVNNCFTSTYDTYLVVASGLTGSTGLNLNMRMRLAGVDDSTASSYVRQVLLVENTSVAGNRAAAATSAEVAVVRSTLITPWQMHLYNPAKATATGFLVQQVDPSNGANIDFYGGTHNVTTAFDGFTLTTSGGTITGSIRVYGYKN